MSNFVLVVRVFFAIVNAFWIASSSAVSIECLLSNLYVCVNVGVCAAAPVPILLLDPSVYMW